MYAWPYNVRLSFWTWQIIVTACAVKNFGDQRKLRFRAWSVLSIIFIQIIPTMLYQNGIIMTLWNEFVSFNSLLIKAGNEEYKFSLVMRSSKWKSDQFTEVLQKRAKLFTKIAFFFQNYYYDKVSFNLRLTGIGQSRFYSLNFDQVVFIFVIYSCFKGKLIMLYIYHSQGTF